MVVDALTKRHGNSVTMLQLFRDAILSMVDEDQELANRKTYRVKHKRNLRPHRQLEQVQYPEWMQWVALTRSKRMRSLASNLERIFLQGRGPMLVSNLFG